MKWRKKNSGDKTNLKLYVLKANKWITFNQSSQGQVYLGSKKFKNSKKYGHDIISGRGHVTGGTAAGKTERETACQSTAQPD